MINYYISCKSTQPALYLLGWETLAVTKFNISRSTLIYKCIRFVGVYHKAISITFIKSACWIVNVNKISNLSECDIRNNSICLERSPGESNKIQRLAQPTYTFFYNSAPCCSVYCAAERKAISKQRRDAYNFFNKTRAERANFLIKRSRHYKELIEAQVPVWEA